MYRSQTLCSIRKQVVVILPAILEGANSNMNWITSLSRVIASTGALMAANTLVRLVLKAKSSGYTAFLATLASMILHSAKGIPTKNLVCRLPAVMAK